MYDENGRDVEHGLQLYWLRAVPGYRELIKQRVHEAAKRRGQRLARMDARLAKLWEEEKLWEGEGDVDNLGREVEGCG